MQLLKPFKRFKDWVIKKKQQKYASFWFTLSYVSLLLFTNVVVILGSIAIFVQTHELHQPPPTSLLILSILFSLLTVIFLIALIKMRKWGFWGYATITILSSVYSSYAFNYDFRHTLAGFLGVGIMYFLLQVGGKKKAWLQLK